MKILIHSNGPMVPTGYGQQVRLLAPRLRDLGHEVAISAFYGLSGSGIEWDGIPIFPAGQVDYGLDVVLPHARRFGADLILTLMDFWKLAPIARELRTVKVAAWLPNDCSPLSKLDQQTLRVSGAVPIAMSMFGQANLEAAGFSTEDADGKGRPPLYAPHMVDCTGEYAPLHEPARAVLRDRAGVADKFVVGINAANRDAARKAFPEQLRGFARFHASHPDSVLFLHTDMVSRSGLNLMELVEDMGLSGAVGWTDQYAMASGAIGTDILCDWYNTLDVLSNCSYGEGFGLPIVEAQACGTPVIVTNDSAMAELRGPTSWAVEGSEFWNPVHRAWWRRPNVSQITQRLTTAYEWWTKRQRPNERLEHRRDRSREFALGYDVDNVAGRVWPAVLEELEAYA